MARETSRLMANWRGVIHSEPTNNFKYSRLQQLRIDAGYKTSKSFAKAANLDVNTYSRIENGNQIASEVQKDKIAKSLKMTIEQAFPERVHKITFTTTYIPIDQLEKELYAQFGDKLYTAKG